jgi:hypothetical protein
MRSALPLFAGAVICAGVFCSSLRAQDFTRGLSAEEEAAIGLAKLSAAERAALIAVVERYRESGVATRSAATDSASPSATVASTPCPEATSTTVPPPASGVAAASGAPSSSAVAAAGRAVRSWIPFLKDEGGKPAAPKPAPAAAADEIVTRLKGELRSFSGRRSFVLQNGEVWEMDESSSYSGPVLTTPEVILRPGILGTHVLKIPDAALRVRVRRAGSR